MLGFIERLNQTEVSLLLLARFHLLGIFEISDFMLETEDRIFILRLFSLFLLFASSWTVPFLFLLFDGCLELLLSRLESQNLSMLLLNVVHYLTLHLRFYFKFLFGFA